MKQHLRSLWTLLLLMMWCSVGFAQTITADFTNGNIPSGWSKTGTTAKNSDYGTQLQKNTSVTSPAFTETISTITINLTRSSNGTIFSIGYIKDGKKTDFKTFRSNDVTQNKLKDYNVVVPTEAQVSGVKFVFTSAKSSYYIKTITFTPGDTKTKTKTTLTFPKAAISINGGDEASFKGQPAKLYAGEQELTDKTIKYAHTGDEIFATFDEKTGAATLKSGVYGTAKVTATYVGDNTYEKSEASYTVKIVDPNAIVPLVFDKADDVFGTLNYHDSNNATISEYSLKGSDGNSYTFKTNGGKDAAKNGNLKLQKNAGTLESPIFENLENGYTVNITFSQLGKYPLEITSGEDSKEADITSENGKNIEGTGFLLSMNIKPGNTFTLNAGNVAYISKIEIVALSGITLDENADDTETKIKDNNGKTVDVKLTRSLKAGLWNTICLPFDVTAEQVESVLKATDNIKEFDKEDKATATIFFKPATEMKAGVPYLIKPTEDATVLNFKGVTINNVDELSRINGNDYCICGVFGKYTMKTNGTELFLNAAGKFVAPAAATNTMKGFRAYFMVPSGASAAAININIDGETTGINNIETEATVNGKVYNLNGQYVGNSLNGLKKGIYVVNGKKVIK